MKLKIKVKPGSGKCEVIKIDGGYLVCLKSRAEDGKANLELLKVLKKYLKIKYGVKDIKIIKGLKSRNKIVEIR